MELDKIYYVNVGPKGTFRASGKYGTSPEDIDNIIVHLKATNCTNLALYFHGGLVNEESGMEGAKAMAFKVSTLTKCHPISFVWETGVMEIAISNLQDLYQTKLFKKILIKVAKIAGKRLGIETSRGARSIGKPTDEEIERELNNLSPFEHTLYNSSARAITRDITGINDDDLRQEVTIEIEQDREIEGLLRAERSEIEKKLLNEDKVVDPQERARGIISAAKVTAAIIKIIYRVIKRHIQKRDHDFFPTIMEEILRELYVGKIGSWLWGQMKDKAELMWSGDTDQTPDLDKHPGNYLIRQLEKYANEINQEVTLNLIGHSAGSIAVAHMVGHLVESNSSLKVKSIFYLAPAIRCELFEEKIMKNAGKFSFFRIFTMSDALEKKDWMLSVVYPHSILFFISGLLEDHGDENDAHILGLQRHITGRSPYDGDEQLLRVKNFLDKTDNTCIYSITQSDMQAGLRSHAIHHTDFDNDDEGAIHSVMNILNL